jgi:hypothetical protein
MAEAMATIINSPDNLRFMKGVIEAPCQLAIKYHVMLSASLQTHSVTPCQQTSSKQKKLRNRQPPNIQLASKFITPRHKTSTPSKLSNPQAMRAKVQPDKRRKAIVDAAILALVCWLVGMLVG